MSSNDFVNGRMAANFANSRAASDAHGAVLEWKEFSNTLQVKLQKTEYDYVEMATQREGFARVLASLKEELKRLDPDNPLLRDEVRHKIYGAGVADKFRELGYDYDTGHGVFRKRG